MIIPTLEMVCDALGSGSGVGVRIAVIDSGVEASHPQLGGLQLTDDLVFSEQEGSVVIADGGGIDMFGHGTAVASIINRVAPRAGIGSFRVLNARLGAKVIIISAAVREAIRRGYHVLSCSFGCTDPYRKYLANFKEWIDFAYISGVHTVAACNNEDFERTEWPGHFPSVLTCNMGRLNNEDLHFRPGNLVEFVARGVDVELPWRGGATKVVSGSSYAAPLLSGLLARLLSIFPDLDPLLAKGLLRRAAKPWNENLAGPNVRSASTEPPP